MENEIIEFFTDLANKQEELDEEFKKVLFDNLWDLYED